MSNDQTLTPHATILLIQEQLKSLKLVSTLSHLGIETCFYQANLIELIMARVGLPADSQVDYGFCFCLLTNHSKHVVEDPDELYYQATCVYRILKARAGMPNVDTTFYLPIS